MYTGDGKSLYSLSRGVKQFLSYFLPFFLLSRLFFFSPHLTPMFPPVFLSLDIINFIWLFFTKLAVAPKKQEKYAWWRQRWWWSSPSHVRRAYTEQCGCSSFEEEREKGNRLPPFSSWLFLPPLPFTMGEADCPDKLCMMEPTGVKNRFYHSIYSLRSFIHWSNEWGWVHFHECNKFKLTVMHYRKHTVVYGEFTSVNCARKNIQMSFLVISYNKVGIFSSMEKGKVCWLLSLQGWFRNACVSYVRNIEWIPERRSVECCNICKLVVMLTGGIGKCKKKIIKRHTWNKIIFYCFLKDKHIPTCHEVMTFLLPKWVWKHTLAVALHP